MATGMNCTSCSFEVSPDFAFCPKCGAKVETGCPSCGFDCPPDFAFCPKCGTAQAQTMAPAAPPAVPTPAADPPVSDQEADRRPVTMLFADLSGFTSLGERLDPEDLRALQSDLHRELASVIKDFEGFLEKFVGDAVLACFGAPIAHEDDPARALGAALAMQERIDVLNGRWQTRLGRALALHIGVETGPVVAGALGSTAEAAYAVTGDMTSRPAARTMSSFMASCSASMSMMGPRAVLITMMPRFADSSAALSIRFCVSSLSGV